MSDAFDLDMLELYAQCQQTDVEDVLMLVAEVRRLRALLTAAPDDVEIEAVAATMHEWCGYCMGMTAHRREARELLEAAVRARKIGGDTDE